MENEQKVPKIRAKKSLGQHFLRSPQVLEAMCEAARVTAADTVLEIGSGMGSLTAVLLEKGTTVIALEKDHRLIPELRQQFQKELESGQLTIKEIDVLDFNPSEIGNKAYKIVANIPYYITGAILEKFLSTTSQPNTMVLLVQKEVAQRIVARDGKESILSISVKCYGTPRVVQKVSHRLFSPPPNVDSAILAIDNTSKDFFAGTTNNNAISEEHFFKILKAGFAHKRKKLRNNILTLDTVSPDIISMAFKNAHLHENTRAEEVSPEQWKILAREISGVL